MPESTSADEHTEIIAGRYGRIRYFANDAVIGSALRLYGEWAENELSLARRLIRTGAVVLDIGAFVGTHALAFSRMVGPEGKVISVEPQPKSFRLLQENVSANGCSNVSLCRAAVGSHSGVIHLPPLNLAERQNFGGTSAAGDDQADDVDARHVTCEVVTIDAMALSRCDFVKLDVEGAESLAVTGATETIERCKPIIYAECNNIESGAKTFSILRSFGYQVLVHVVDAYNEGNFKGEKRNIFGDAREASLLAVPARQRDRIAQLADPTWQLFDVETLDDLAYALLQKPQYFDEFLRSGAAARVGGAVVSAADHRRLREEFEGVRRTLAELEQAHQHETEARAEAVAQLEDVQRQRNHEAAERRRAEELSETRGRSLHAQAVRLEDAKTRLVEVQAQLDSLREQAERENARRDQERAEHLAAIARLQLSSDELAEIRRSRLFRLFRRTIAGEMRLRRTLRERRRLRRERAAGGLQKPATKVPAGSPLQDRKRGRSATATIEVRQIGDARRSLDPSTRPLLVCISHVAPWPPRAGNEYRIHRLLHWVQSAGWDVALLLCPLAGEALTEARLLELAGVYRNLVVVDRDGLLQSSVVRQDLASAVESLRKRPVRDFASVFGESGATSGDRIQQITRSFCPDALIEVLAAIDHAASPAVVHSNYAFMARSLAILGASTLKVIDTHDVFSSKAAKVLRFGIDDTLSMSPQEERSLLRNADLLIAIQPDEADELRALLPDTRVVTVGVDMPEPPSGLGAAEQPVILMIGSANVMNRKGLRDFLRFAWPLVLDAVPDAHLQVVGSVGEVLSGHEDGVRWLGMVDRIDDVYARARVVINPAVAGTGLKIKTLEALSRLRPIVLWPSGVDGLPEELRSYCDCVTDWFSYAEAVIRLLADRDGGDRLVQARDRIARLLSPEHVYAEYGRILAHHGKH